MRGTSPGGVRGTSPNLAAARGVSPNLRRGVSPHGGAGAGSRPASRPTSVGPPRRPPTNNTLAPGKF